MAQGFTYNGIHSSRYNIYYVPDPEAFGDIFTEYSVTDEKVPGRDGGYYIKSQADVKSFDLTCFFEDVTEKQRWEIERWLDRKTKGYLIFDEAPYVRWYVHPTEKPELETYQRENCAGTGEVFSGTIEIHFKAYEPYGELTVQTADEVVEEVERTYAQTGLIDEAMMPYVAGQEMTSGSYFVYNPGTKQTPTRVLFKGAAGNGITIANTNNTDELKIVGVTEAITAECAIAYDARYGTVRQNYAGADHEFAYLYHDAGYITLEPSNATRDIHITGAAGLRDITSDGAFTKTMENQYIYINGEWYQVGQVVDASHAILNIALNADADETTVVATMNLITVSVSNNSIINSLTMEFIPRV